MPMISVRTTAAVSCDAEKALTAKLGEAIALIPGKSEAHLMLSFEDNARMAFAGKADKTLAFVEVYCFGAAQPDAYNNLTAAICDMLCEELAIPPDGAYVKYIETVNWGWNGKNF